MNLDWTPYVGKGINETPKRIHIVLNVFDQKKRVKERIQIYKWGWHCYSMHVILLLLILKLETLIFHTLHHLSHCHPTEPHPHDPVGHKTAQCFTVNGIEVCCPNSDVWQSKWCMKLWLFNLSTDRTPLSPVPPIASLVPATIYTTHRQADSSQTSSVAVDSPILRGPWGWVDHRSLKTTALDW